MTKHDFTMVRGDTFAFDAVLKESLADSVEAVYFSAKQKPSGVAYVFQKSLNDGITKENNTTFRVRVAPEDTAGLIPGRYVYDLEFTIDGEVYTALLGNLQIIQDITV